jgi:hypothetical protein
VTEQLLQHEPADARAGIDRRQDEHRLEHDREVIPEREAGTAEDVVKDTCHADGQARCAAGARQQRRFAHFLGERRHVIG